MSKSLQIPTVETTTNYSLGSDQPDTHAFMEYGGSLYLYKGGNLHRMEPAEGSGFSDNGIPHKSNVFENEPFPVEDILKRDDVPDAFKVGLMRVQELADDGLLVVLERDKMKLEPKQEPAPTPVPEEPDTAPTANSFSIDKDGNIDTAGMSPDELAALQERMSHPNFDTIIQDAKDACKHSGEQSVNVEISPGNAGADYGPGPVGVITIPPSVSISSPSGETLISYPTGFGHSTGGYVTPDWMDRDLPRDLIPDSPFDDILPSILKDMSDRLDTQPSISSRATEIDGPSDYLRNLDPEQVKAIQTMLGVEPDGKWGQDTMAAYQPFMRDNKLSSSISFDQLYSKVTKSPNELMRRAPEWLLHGNDMMCESTPTTFDQDGGYDPDKATHFAAAAAKLVPNELLNEFCANKGTEFKITPDADNALIAGTPTNEAPANNGGTDQVYAPS